MTLLVDGLEGYSDGHRHVDDSTQPFDTGREAKVVLNGTAADDWDRVLALAHAHPGTVLPQLGLHPWRMPATREELEGELDALQRLLEAHPRVGLGECGLDKSGEWSKTFDLQLHAFRRQIGIAVALRRPLSVHCVRCASQLYNEIKSVAGRVPVLLHGWSGSAEMTHTFAQLDHVYFSLNLTLLNRKSRSKSTKTVRAVPADRLVLESDGPDGRLRSLDDWHAWFREVDPDAEDGGSFVEESLLMDAVRRGSHSSILLMAHAVGAAVGLAPNVVLAQSTATIERIFG